MKVNQTLLADNAELEAARLILQRDENGPATNPSDWEPAIAIAAEAPLSERRELRALLWQPRARRLARLAAWISSEGRSFPSTLAF